MCPVLKKVHKWFAYLALVGLILGIIPVASNPRTASAQAAIPPVNLLGSIVVSDWTVASPRLIWLNYPACSTPPTPPTSAGVSPQATSDPVTINRISTTGSSIRTIYSRNDPRNPGVCNPYVLNSNIVADANYIYWVEGTALVRLSVNANPGEPPQLWGSVAFNSSNPVALAIANDHVLALQVSNCTRFCISGTGLELVSKADGSNIHTFVLFETGSSSPSFDGKYIYYKDADKNIRRTVPGNSQPTTIVASNGLPVGDYLPEGEITQCRTTATQIICTTTSYVFYIINNTIVRYNNVDGNYFTVYTPNPPNGQAAELYGLALGKTTLSSVTGGASLFFFEHRYTPSDNQFVVPATDLLFRTSRSGGTPDTLYVRDTDDKHPSVHLVSDQFSLYWAEQATNQPPTPKSSSTVRRLSANAEALPKVNLVATGLEITQGIQKSNNSVPLIQGRRTFVRFFVHADGTSVPAVKAQLILLVNGAIVGVLVPMNPNVGSKITVMPIPNKDDINQSFLFELPPDIVGAPNLRLRAVVNPFHIPEEPNYADNVSTAGPFTFQPSPQLIANMISFSYTYKGTNYSVNELRDIAQATSLVRRMFPLASTPGFYSSEPGESGLTGFRPLLRSIADDGIAGLLDYSVPADKTPQLCKYLLTFDTDGKTVKQDERNYCATDHVISTLNALRNENRLPDNPSYGFIPYPAGLSPRGRADGTGISAGPSDNPSTVAHELGHDEGRNHPFNGSKDDTNVCGNTLADGAYDRSYPYKDSLIGPGDGSVTGFDSGDTSFLSTNIPMALTSDTVGHDIMGYCGNRWISDYTYNGIYNFMVGKKLQAQAATQQIGGEGDWLNITGSISTGGNTQIIYLRRVSNVADTPARQPGAYSLHLLDNAGTLLADYPFTPNATHHGGGSQNFSLVVPFVAGTREVRLVTSAQLSANSAFICQFTPSEATTAQAPINVLVRQQVSSNPPVISDVALQNPPDPIAGPVMLAWNASDPDGDALSFDVLYSRDNGATFQPIHLHVTGNSLVLDTTTIGGGPTLFQVIASDGAQSAHANSDPVTLTAAPPRPRITNPGDGTRFEWEQLVNLSGEASDAQDGSIAGANLVWSDQHGTLGTGPVLPKTNLRVGNNVITLTATNSAGLSASTSITVLVSDDLTDPGPTFSVAPSAITFNVAPGTTQVVSTQLAIINAGGGTLSWTASSNAPWLTLSAASGDVPASLTVIADPSGFKEGQTATATLTLTAANAQPVSVPVTLSVGNTVSQPLPPGEIVPPDGGNPPSGGDSKTIVYLPVVAR